MSALLDETYLDDLYSELCLNHSQKILEIQNSKIRDNGELLRILSKFEETKFSKFDEILKIHESDKNADKSNLLREAGNKLYATKKNHEALKVYSEAISLAPQREPFQGRELSLALANRSAVLCQMNKFRDALRDIEHSIEAGYPTNMLYKLNDRRLKCFKGLSRSTLTQTFVEDFRESIETANTTEEKRDLLRIDLDKALKQFKIEDLTKLSTEKNQKKLPKISSPNKHFPAFSDAIVIKSEEGRGRFGVASRNISLGEILCVETPPVANLHPEYLSSHCYQCFQQLLSLIPSPHSSKKWFCSRDCYEEEKHSHHVESSFHDVVTKVTIRRKEWLLGLKSLTKHPLQYFLDHGDLINGEKDDNYGINSDEVYETNDLRAVMNLVTHHDTWDISTLIYKAFITLFFIRCLQSAQYFGSYQSEAVKELSKEEVLVGKMMSHVMEVASMNSHEIGLVARQEGETQWMSAQVTAVGCALEPTLVLLNHSCDPSMIRVNLGTSTIAFASRNIAKGEEITDCYTYPFDITPGQERRLYLKEKYKFLCQCQACKENWPTAARLPKSFTDISHQQFKLDQNDFEEIQRKMKNVMLLGAKINQLQKTEDFSGMVDLNKKFDSSLNEVIVRPHLFHVMARRSLGTCLWVLHGNKM